MKTILKTLLTITLLLFASSNSFAQSWDTDVSADRCSWTSFNNEHDLPAFSAGEKVVITARGSWISNGQTFRYNGSQHRDARHVCEECWAMALLVRFVDSTGETIKEFKNNKQINYTFKGNGKIYFICNDDMNNQKHCKDNRGYVTAVVTKKN